MAPAELDDIRELLLTSRTIAVMGLSPKRERPSYRVAEYLQRNGYRIIPVNPGATKILREPAVRSLEVIEEPVGIVDIFRRAEFVPDIVESAIAIGAKVVWMQEGIVHEEARRRARDDGLRVVMDRCLLKDHQALMASP